MIRKLGRVVLAATLLVVGIEASNTALFAQNQRSAPRQVKRRVPPEYPELAKRMNVTGKVRVEVVIAPDGHVTLTHALGGHPVLVQAVENAVKDWRFAAAADTTKEVVEMEFAGTEVR
jgi:TonB family protein